MLPPKTSTTPLLILAFAAVVVNTISHNTSVESVTAWNAWKVQHKRLYMTRGEEAHRLAVWRLNLAKIEAHNRRADAGLVTYRLGMNKFGDFSHAEFVQRYQAHPKRSSRKNALPDSKATARHTTLPRANARRRLPHAVDWRKKGYVTPVKDQGNCGSCYAFSSTGSLEGQWKRKTGKLLSLSEQQIIDCSFKEGDLACNGGLPNFAFDYVMEFGIETEKDYPYTGVVGNCIANTSRAAVHLKGFFNVTQLDERAMMEAVAHQGPIAVAIDAEEDFKFYKSGIYKSLTCNNNELDHAVLIVGYGSSKSPRGKFWLIKNSWGANWGEAGYIRFAKGDPENMCGILENGQYPDVEVRH